jgi:UMF1 family MFS transporter
LHREDPDVYLKFYALGGFIGLVLGAIQTLSRSTYSKLIPDDTEDHATYFSFYDVLEKVAIVLGMVLAGLVTTYTHSLRLFILILAIFFVAGFIILSFMKKTKYVK